MRLQKPETLQLVAVAERSARRYCRHRTACWLDPEDLRQDLLVDLIARLKSYDPARGSVMTFVTICFRHEGARRGSRARSDAHRRSTISIDTPLSTESDLTLADTLAETDGYAHRIGGNGEVLPRAENLLDLDRALSSLPAECLSLCVLLLRDERDPVSASGLPRTTFYRRLSELRCHLLAAGILAPVAFHGKAQ